MIKIIKQGKKPKQTKAIYKTTCSVCGCEFEFELEDCDKLEKSLNGNLYLYCPCCGEAICNKRDSFECREVEVDE